MAGQALVQVIARPAGAGATLRPSFAEFDVAANKVRSLARSA
jgi:hypothetical protein